MEGVNKVLLIGELMKNSFKRTTSSFQDGLYDHVSFRIHIIETPTWDGANKTPEYKLPIQVSGCKASDRATARISGSQEGSLIKVEGQLRVVKREESFELIISAKEADIRILVPNKTQSVYDQEDNFNYSQH